MQKNETYTRDPSFDILRGIGLLCIMLAHVGPPTLLFQLRNFDVPLMVLISGSVFCISSGRKVGYFRYIIERFVRLVIPTWIFLAFFFITSFIGFNQSTQHYPFSLQQIELCFGLLYDYVWVIRVFLLVAIMAPLIMQAKSVIKSNLAWYFLVVFFYVIYEILFVLSRQIDSFGFIYLLDNFVFSAIPYGVVFAVGITAIGMNRKQFIFVSLVFLCFFVIMALWKYRFTGSFMQTQSYKYPPRFYYLSYAFGVSFFFYSLMTYNVIKFSLIGNLLSYLGSRTMWIYLWHIYVLFLMKWLGFDYHFLVKLVILITTSVSLALLQEIMVSLAAEGISNTVYKKSVIKVFTG